MNLFLTLGTRIVVFALISYTIAIVTEQRKHKANKTVLTFITLGIILDITATVFMIAGSSNSAFTLHGMLGYSSLAAMLIDALLLWKFRLTNAEDTEVPSGLHQYSRYAFIWWVLAFITGALLVLLK